MNTKCKQRADALHPCYRPPFDELMALGGRTKRLMDFVRDEKEELALKELEEIRGILDKVEATIKEYMSEEPSDSEINLKSGKYISHFAEKGMPDSKTMKRMKHTIWPNKAEEVTS